MEYDVQIQIIKEIKGLSMCLSRFKPADWNKFLDVVIKWIKQMLYLLINNQNIIIHKIGVLGFWGDRKSVV